MSVNKGNLKRYTYYDENKKHIAVLNKDYITMLLGVDEVVFEEPDTRHINTEYLCFDKTK